MSADQPSSTSSILHWLKEHAGFPARRLPEKAELMLLMYACAQAEAASAEAAKSPIQRRDAAKDSAMRAHAMRRSMVHYRCDNSAKV